ncbi:MAG: hypothetical protein SVG88_13575, partial [Halobacteriales archaeon]|nr:hypothetical protein [Halobacteriales archaeon]
MVSLIGGLVGGLVATIVMTAFMMALGDDSPPPTALFYSKYLGDGEPEEYMMQGMFLHAMYGIGAGVVFAYLGVAGLMAFTPLTLANGLINGLVYGFILFIGAAVFWMKIVLDIDAEPPQVAMFLLFHLIYGGVLGAWVGL